MSPHTKILLRIHFRRLSASCQGGLYDLVRTAVNQADIFYRNIQDLAYLCFPRKVGLKTRDDRYPVCDTDNNSTQGKTLFLSPS